MSGITPNGNHHVLPDRAKGWIKRWTVRFLIYSALTWPFATAVFLPYYVLIVGFTWHQLVVYLVTSFPASIVAYLALAPFGKWVWGSIWRIQHGVQPWWRADDKAAAKASRGSPQHG